MGVRVFVLMPVVLALALLASQTVCHAEAAPAVSSTEPVDPFPLVPTLRPQVDFWIDVFSRLHQNEVVLHDTQYPQLQYETFTLPGTVTSGLDRSQHRALDEHKRLLVRRLESLEQKLRHGEALTAPEQSLQQQLRAAGGDAAVTGAAQRVRAQRGLRERFLAGVRTSGRYLERMRRIFAERGMPEDLAYLPHVESSFDIDARSSVGAAGIWQFTRATGRRYLHINNAIDERLDPIAATRAAADYLAAAHQLLGDWGLAITAYNHGLSGILRAAREHGTDLESIVRDYRADSFGFASSNFYTEFLAVRTILGQPQRYFDSPLSYDAALELPVLELPRQTSATRLARLLDTDTVTLAAVNPAWTERTLRGQVSLPAGTRIWLPRHLPLDSAALDRQLAEAEPGAPPLPVADSASYRVRSGDTLGGIAGRHGISLSALRRANGIRYEAHLIQVGQRLVLPDTHTVAHHPRSTGKPSATLHSVRHGENPFTIARRYRIPLDSLLAANGLDANAIIRPGQHLRIPSAASP